MSPLRLNGSTSGYAELAASAAAGDVVLTIPNVTGTLDRLNRAGNILQVVNATYSTQTSSSSSTYADTGLTATITPTSASSKILAIINQVGCFKTTSDTAIGLRLLRGSSSILEFESVAGGTVSTASNASGSASACYLDSPATTSPVTYKTQLKSTSNSAIVYVQLSSAGISPASTITLMEVAA